ncbi:hypothetical protein ASG89_01780 [Paenibacillus sp. Soil766]|uniref:ABC transporter substrate-binding protein n=1 Tax=Paenibacillus sp. Soil766 TaxID=1736404 RepID=UPI00070FB570|nr:ABC transporter substrate-binding protein [Paenibacillus sp. Soil766]KRF10287.1 hypothetical protein ASG89_01780 [Paenibacillus sp. Soil766]
MRKMRRTLVQAFTVITAIAMLSACSSNSTAPSGKDPEVGKKEELVKLKWVVRSAPQKDLPAVQEAINNIIRPKINTEVDIQFIDPGAPYDQKVNTMIAANDDFDILFTGASPAFGDFYGQVTKGALQPITDLVKKYAPKTYASIPEGFWKSVTVNNQIYAIPNYQIVARQHSIVAEKRLLDKYSFDLNSVKKLEDLTPFLAKVHDGEGKQVTPFGMDKNGYFASSSANLYTISGLDTVGSLNTVGAVRIDDVSLKVINQFEQPEFKQYVTLMHSWFEKGYINQDATTLANILPALKTGNVATFFNNTKPGGLVDTKVNFGNVDVVEKIIDTPIVTNDNVASTLQAISKNSKHPDKAIQFLELMNTDKEIYNLICFGIENKHYKKTGDNRIEQILNSGYAPNRSWTFGNQFNAYLLPAQPDNVWQETIDLNKNSKQSKMLGFVFNTEPVKSEIAQCQSVMDEYRPALESGFVEPEKMLPEFLAKLKTAGADKIIVEKQKQLDAWKATNK